MALYLGLDCSTQSVKALVIDPAAGTIRASAAVNFGRDLPQFDCPEGVLAHPDPLIRHSPPLMWVAALDLVLARLVEQGAPMAAIRGISGAGQQHGSVYLNASADSQLASLVPSRSLADQLAGIFSRETSPVWMDSSTARECEEITALVGERLRLDTGSPATERFTGPQIRKFFKDRQPAYAATSRVHLVSSFMGSVLIGKSMAVDTGDGAGMNLLNLKTGDWDEGILAATAPGLRDKLPPVRPAAGVGGGLHPYFSRYGLTPGIPVVLWTGDNPSSLVGVGAAMPGTAVISLGTSDTFFAAMPAMKTDPQGYGNVFGNPAGGYMSLICFKNGSLARERVKEECRVDWEGFSRAVSELTRPGNDGNMALSYYVPEITPRVLQAGVRRRGAPEFLAGRAAPEVALRAALEGQVCSMRVMSGWIGDFTRIRVTGGGSRSDALVKMIADVFQADVELIAVPDSAALGAALRAAAVAGGYALEELAARFTGASRVVHPDPGLAAAYGHCTQAYAKFIQEGLAR